MRGEMERRRCSKMAVMEDPFSLAQVLQQVLGRKVWIVDSIDQDTVPFG